MSDLYMKAQKVTGKYNHNDKCFQHAPKRIPRVRGHELIDGRKKK